MIRKIILESVGHPKMDELVKRFLDDPRGLIISIDDRKIYNGYFIQLIDPGETADFDLNVIGKVAIAIYPTLSKRCHGAYQIVGYSKMNQQDNLGPLLYDIAIELTGENGLMSDRTTVSKEAYAMWEKYLLVRKDVKRKQLDDRKYGWTDTKEDDCGLVSSFNAFIERPGNDLFMDDLDEKYKEYIQGEKTSPLSKVYYKEGTPVLDMLKDRVVRNRESITDVILGGVQ